ncbi:hypothetical protein KUTeg_023243 [Tegillarca granosa]|uniref:phosphoinositide 5-phosphatase n=1 Tax=Tegillarca granosa TaxID=220873 RepID=A0ABQ9E130_TEGGR|nr:hypothetical protein KUTeg_023243 [Tegillarca granosa]
MAMTKNFRVYHKLEPPYSVLVENRNNEETLMFESNALALQPKLKPLKNREENILYCVLVTGCLSVGKVADSEIFRITSTQFVSLRNFAGDEEKVGEVRKLLNSGTFYFAWSNTGIPWDLTLCAQRKNRMLHVHFQRFGVDTDQWLLKIICGGVEIRTIYAAHRQAKACLISRLSCERAGTRFNVRGTNDDGNVANFVETEQVGSHKVRMSRGHEASAPAFDNHIRMIKQLYGEQVMINLLGRKEGEHMLSQAFESHHKASVHRQDTPLINFDYHTECRGGNLKNLERLKQHVIKYLDNFDFFYCEAFDTKKYQTGTVRSNCLDCLDRTNAVQTLLALEILPRQLEVLGLANKPQMVSRFVEIYKQIWTVNGDHVSRIYAGTGALGGGRSKVKQEAIDVLLIGNSLRGELADKARALLSTKIIHAPPPILHAMVNSYLDYTSTSSLRVGIGTWNVNGGKHFRSIAFKHQSMTDWLLDAPKILSQTNSECVNLSADLNIPVDVFAIGFEEIVDLNASNIMKVSTTNAREWQKEIQKTISRDHKYVLLTSVQLVGVILYVFIRPHIAPFIRDVAVDSTKTGLGGATGNKGGVAIRFLYHSTSICFVCAHLAAGQSQVQQFENNGRTISSHDYVFWCGDFNYRVDLPNEEVKNDKCRTPAWTDRVLWRRKPLIKHNQDGLDQSENWNPGKLVSYGRSELKTSDHRPVMAVIDIEVLEVQEKKKKALLDNVIRQQGPPDGTVIVSVANGDFDDDMVDSVVETFSDIGEIILVRFVEDDMWLIFRMGKSALEAVKFDKTEINGKVIQVKLKTDNWESQIEKELSICMSNTGALFNTTTNSLLGEEFAINMVDFEEDGRNSPAISDDGLLDTNEHYPLSSLMGPPSQPKTSPSAGSLSTLTASKSSENLIVKEETVKIRGAPSPETRRKQPPQRPSAPPAKPPPPKRPPGGPSVAGQAPKKPAAPTRQPLGPQVIGKIKAKKANVKITNIGLPTNVSHHSHASSVEEAQKLIEQLMTSGNQSTLPAPLLPDANGTDTSMPRSKTTEFTPQQNQSIPILEAPKPIPRVQSAGNISKDNVQEQPIRPLRMKDSPTEEMSDNKPQPRPRPAPRRDVQSCVVTNEESSLTTPPIPQSRPVSTAVRGTAPPLPENRQNDEIMDTQFQTNFTGNRPAVPERTINQIQDSSHMNSLLDEPLSPGHQDPVEDDPFDTSCVPNVFLNKAPPPVPQRTVNESVNLNLNSEFNLHAKNVQCVQDINSQNDFNTQQDDATFSPPSPKFSPPSIPFEYAPPSQPPPPPPREDSYMNTLELVSDDTSPPPPSIAPPPLPRPNLTQNPAENNLPPVPARPSQATELNNMPPVPSRPSVTQNPNPYPQVPARTNAFPPVPPRS